jgi:hypothetical protein
MSAAKIMVIRHAEKPGGNAGDPAGVTIAGAEDKDSLIVQGWQRAGALAPFFAAANTALGLAVPDVIFASNDKKQHESGGIKEGSHSKRPIETVTPLGAKLDVALNTDFLLGDEAELVATAQASTGVVLICWQHEAIPAIANRLVPSPNDIPQHWPGSRFDVVWVFDPTGSGSWTFSQVPQNLLAGDIDSPIT